MAGSRNVTVQLQRHKAGRGVTDIELQSPGHFHVIIEAKRGWNLPPRGQLETYAARNSFTENAAPLRRLVVLSECSRDYAEYTFGAHEIGGACPTRVGEGSSGAREESAAKRFERGEAADRRTAELPWRTHHHAETRL